jgi:hypothetical protein
MLQILHRAQLHDAALQTAGQIIRQQRLRSEGSEEWRREWSAQAWLQLAALLPGYHGCIALREVRFKSLKL